MEVLYVDRDEDHRELAFGHLDAEVETASSFDEAMNKYDGQHVISDYILGGLETGLDIMDEVEDFTLYSAYSRDFIGTDSGRNMEKVDFVQKGNKNSWDKLNRRLE